MARAFQVASIFPLTVEREPVAAVTSRRGDLLLAVPPRTAGGRPAARARRDHGHARPDQRALALRATSRTASRSCLISALALALDPKVLLLDEPTAGMGPEERWDMIEKVMRSGERRALTVVFIEHDMDIVFKIAEPHHRCSEIRPACWREGTPDEIRARPGRDRRLSRHRPAQRRGAGMTAPLLAGRSASTSTMAPARSCSIWACRWSAGPDRGAARAATAPARAPP